jgi:hypothetical protein
MARSIGRFAGERVALGAREVDDDLGLVFEFGMEFVLDGGEGAEEQVAGVGHDGGAAGVDFVPGLEFIEFAEGAVDNDRGAEFLGVSDEGGSKVGLVEVFLVLGGVFGAEARLGVGDGQTAESLAGKTMLTMKLNRGSGDAGGFVIHGSSFPAEPARSILGRVGIHPGCFRMSGK